MRRQISVEYDRWRESLPVDRFPGRGRDQLDAVSADLWELQGWIYGNIQYRSASMIDG